MTRVLVCGGRDYADKERLFKVLDELNALEPFTLLIHGGARGADTLAGEWGIARGVTTLVFHANWEGYGKAAGSIRNAKMLNEGKPNYIIAFPGGRGTADMVRRGRTAGVLMMEVT